MFRPRARHYAAGEEVFDSSLARRRKRLDCSGRLAMTFDGIDAKILALLQTNNRLTSEQIGRRIHLSSTAVATRVNKQRDSGLIAAAVALLGMKRWPVTGYDVARR